LATKPLRTLLLSGAFRYLLALLLRQQVPCRKLGGQEVTLPALVSASGRLRSQTTPARRRASAAMLH
jgi:hypothetical protein